MSLIYKYLNIYTQYLNIYTGEWLYSVFPTSRAAPARLTGFVHAEDHYWTQVCIYIDTYSYICTYLYLHI